MNTYQVYRNRYTSDTMNVNMDTGELVESYEDTHYLVPIDISGIGSKEQYDSLITEHIGKKKYRLVISPVLLDLVVDKVIPMSTLCIFCLLGQKVGYRNMVYTNTKELIEGSGYGRTHISRALSELSINGFIRECDNKLKEKGDRLILVSPLYFFLGYYPHRDGVIKDWYKGDNTSLKSL